MTVRHQTSSVKFMRKGHRNAIPNDRYLYLSSRIKALESQLLDSARLGRLSEARSIEDINQILTESGYAAAPDPETRLLREIVATFELLHSLFPEPGFIDAMLLFHDFHNLKVIMKSLTSAWPQRQNPDEAVSCDNLPESAGPFGLASSQDLEPFFLEPSLVDPAVLFIAVRDRQSGQIPAWLYSAAVKSAQVYQQSYDIGDIDVQLDRLAFSLVMAKASRLGNTFFSCYLQLLVDQTNLGLLLRTRFLKCGKTYLGQALLAGGSLPAGQVLGLYDSTPEEIQSAYAFNPCAILARMAGEYGQAGTAGRFSLLADNLIIEYVSKAKLLWRGPEIPLAYLIARLMEIKNIRIALTCLRNGLPVSQAREMTRESYATWR
jgi:V/A-type H+-transporting ATPase subunit C